MKKLSGQLFLVTLLTLFPITLPAQKTMQPSKEYSMLCLGDSYTIGESVAEADRFPNQAVVLLHSKGVYVEKPRIIAATGWTTDELMTAIRRQNIHRAYDFVTLLIGVNNQYRGLSATEYRKEFIGLLELSIQFSGNKKNHVVVLSIPDWGVTKFGENSDREKVAREIDLFNSINREESLNHEVHYIDITGLTREHADWLADDGLHPSAKMYAEWAALLSRVIESEVK
jgi:lysophospholipase L1-like esterase